MFAQYFGLIEAVFVFGLALAFYVWQMRSLKRDVRAREAREAAARRATEAARDEAKDPDESHRA